MIKLIYVQLSLILAVIFISIPVLANSSIQTSTDSSGRLQAGTSLADSIKTVYTFGGAGSDTSSYGTYISSIYERASGVAADHEFSDKELIRLGVWEDEDGFEHSLRTLSGTMYRYYAAQGCLPATSDDVIAALGGDKASLLGHLYNPITDELYASFTATEWDINSVNVEITTDINEAKQILMNRYPEVDFGSPAYPEPTGAIRIVVYGEEPGSVIFDDYFF